MAIREFELLGLLGFLSGPFPAGVLW
jgi:hypothetical protein